MRIGGYPEGHGHISAELIERALERKAPHATHVITQLCFHPSTTTAWARQVKQRGVDLPIRIGLPGAVTRQKLVRISAGLALGQSARFLSKQHREEAPEHDSVAYALTRSTGTLVGKDTGAGSRKSDREPFVLGRRNGAREVGRYMSNQPW